MFTAARTTSGITVTYYFMGSISRYISTAQFTNKDDLRNKPEESAMWKAKVTKFCKFYGPDKARADILTMSTPHKGGSDPEAPNHVTVSIVNTEGKRLVRFFRGQVISKFHIPEDETLWTVDDYDEETPLQTAAREKREEEMKAKKALLMAERLLKQEQPAKNDEE